MKNPKTKEKKPSLKELIESQCGKDENLILMDITEESAFIIKKKFETVRRELCPGTMNPVEILEDVTFFHFFILVIEPSKNKIKKMLKPFEEKGFSIYYVESDYDIFKAINDA